MILDCFMSSGEVAQELGLSRQTIGELCRQGRLTGAKKIANHWIIPRDAVNNYLRQPLNSKKDKEIIQNALEEDKRWKKLMQ